MAEFESCSNEVPQCNSLRRAFKSLAKCKRVKYRHSAQTSDNAAALIYGNETDRAYMVDRVRRLMDDGHSAREIARALLIHKNIIGATIVYIRSQ